MHLETSSGTELGLEWCREGGGSISYGQGFTAAESQHYIPLDFSKPKLVWLADQWSWVCTECGSHTWGFISEWKLFIVRCPQDPLDEGFFSTTCITISWSTYYKYAPLKINISRVDWQTAFSNTTQVIFMHIKFKDLCPRATFLKLWAMSRLVKKSN